MTQNGYNLLKEQDSSTVELGNSPSSTNSTDESLSKRYIQIATAVGLYW